MTEERKGGKRGRVFGWGVGGEVGRRTERGMRKRGRDGGRRRRIESVRRGAHPKDGTAGAWYMPLSSCRYTCLLRERGATRPALWSAQPIGEGLPRRATDALLALIDKGTFASVLRFHLLEPAITRNAPENTPGSDV